MKLEKGLVVLTAAVLSCLLAIGAVGCLVTGFQLDLERFSAVLALCVAASVLFSALFAWRWGAAAALCLMALLGGWLWHRGIVWEQILGLVSRISGFYHNAYHWGQLSLGDPNAPADLPLALLGGIIALTAASALVRGKRLLLPLILTALPLASCLVVTDTVPDTPYLFTLLAAVVICLLTQSVRRESPFQGCRLTALVTLPVLLALGLLFWAVPAESYVNRSADVQDQLLALVEDLPQKAQNAVQEVSSGIQTEEQQSLDLKGMGPRPRYTHAILEATPSTSGTLYLRGQDYDAYTGTGWTASSHRAEPFGLEGEPDGTITISTRTKKEVLYLPYYTADVFTLAGGSLKNSDGLKEYAFSYTLPPEIPEETIDHRLELTDLEVSHFGSTADRLRYLTLPGQTRVKAEEILASILPEGASRRETAEAIAEFVKNSAEYDLNTGRMPTEATDFALWFLAESDTGYCVHFATAAVVLLRAADIPARYVTGYLTQAEAGETVTVTAGDAHAWAEYYVPQLESWVVLDATPAEEETIEAAPVTNSPESPETIPVYIADTQPEVTQPSSQSTIPMQEPEEDSPKSYGWLYTLLAFLLIAGAVWAQRQLRLMLRQKRMDRGTPNKKALARWVEATRLARLLKQAPPEALKKLAQKAKFSQHILTDEELAEFDTYLEDSRTALKAQPWYWQPLYQYFWVVY